MSIVARRRWFAFSLRTLLVGVTLIACWFGYSLNWIRQRHEALMTLTYFSSDDPFADGPEVPAPGGLWLFGEKGVFGINLSATAARADTERKRLNGLFPEAKINLFISAAP